jgi:molybdate transport system permease protein
MEWSAFFLSLSLSLISVTILLVLGLLIARSLAWKRFVGKGVIEALITLHLVLPPTV